MQDKREQIEAVATAAIKRAGIGNVSFRTLAEAVGVKSASVHYHFPTKADLALAVVEAYTQTFQASLDRADRKSGSGQDKLLAFAKVFEDVLADENLCLCGMMASEVMSLDDATRSALTQFFRNAEDWVAGVLKQHSAELNAALPPADIARILMSGLEGAILLDRVEMGRARIRSFRRFIKSLF